MSKTLTVCNKKNCVSSCSTTKITRLSNSLYRSISLQIHVRYTVHSMLRDERTDPVFFQLISNRTCVFLFKNIT